MSELTPRATVALKLLAERTTPYAAPPSNHRDDAAWTKWLDGRPRPFKKILAFQVADAIEHAGLYRKNPRAAGTRPASGAANTLQGLKRRGLAANDGGGAWLSAEWWITPEGLEAAR
jgi:hypothetical protein